MATVTSNGSASIEGLMANLQTFKYNPSAMQRVILDHLEEITDGKVNIVDPTNPFVFLLEASCVNTALAITESTSNLRKQYASLALTDNDLYSHMSDKDFLNRFATPGTVNFTVVFQTSEVLNKMVYDSSEECHKAIIPRDSYFTVGELTFTLQYPIVLRKYANGTVQVSYDADIASPIDSLTTNQIPYLTRTDGNNVSWFFFTIPVRQMEIVSEFYALQRSTPFSKDIIFKDQFYFVRAYYRNAATNNLWTEIKTTHSDQIFDPLAPTALVKVYDDYINMSLPIIYQTSGLVSGEIRFDVYTTKGDITTDLSGYKVSAFSMNLRAIDEERDINDYTNAMIGMSYYGFSAEVVSGGSDGLSFEECRSQVIDNSTGQQQVPITNVALGSKVSYNSFDLIRNSDVVTNRIVLASRKLPTPTNTKLLTAANIGISTFISSLQNLREHADVLDNTSRLTIRSNNLFIIENGVVRLLTRAEVDAVYALNKTEMIADINAKQYIYNPYYYVLDNAEKEFEVRAYDLDQPALKNLNFISQNQTLQLVVNTNSYRIDKVSAGYLITVSTKSGNFYKQLAHGEVGMQLGFYPVGESSQAFINGTYAGLTADEERIFEFLIETNHDLNSSGNICITNARMFTNESIELWMSLNGLIDLYHTTTSQPSTYKADESDAKLGKFLLPVGSMGNTHEQLTVDLGVALKNLWTRSRTVPGGMTYETYDHDVPMVYERDVYEVDAVSGLSVVYDSVKQEVVYKIIHHQNDPVLDNDGNQVWKFRKGDIKLDINGKPVTVNGLSLDKEMDILFVDGKYFFADDSKFASYKTEIAKILTTWVSQNIADIQKVLLEKTKIYFYPKTTLGSVLVFTPDDGEVHVDSEQSLVLDLYVTADIYKDSAIRSRLKNYAIKTLDDMIGQTTVNVTEVETELKAVLGDSVKAISLSGLGGSNNYRILTLADEHNRLCVKKSIQQQQDTTLIISEAVTVEFHKVS